MTGPLWAPDYDTPLAWQAAQQAAPGRITVESRDALPGRYSRWKPTGNAMHVRLLPGELTGTSTRSEVYARAASPMSGTPPQDWPDPVGAERWYGWSLLIPAGFTFATDPSWLVCTQWKGYRGGSPPISIEIRRNRLVLGGARTNAGLVPRSDLGVIRPGVWTRLVVGLHLSTGPDGWVEAWRDDKQAVPRTAVATMDAIGGQPDPIYLKQGIYRDPAWQVAHELYFGPITVGASRTDVA